jgi:uncharacterized protein (TIGR03435 family)
MMIRLRKSGLTGACLVILFLANMQPSPAQTPPLAFEAASVRPVNPNVPEPLDFRITGGRLASTNWTLAALVREAYSGTFLEAYGARFWQISGGPKWFDTDRFDVEATAAGAPARNQMLVMLQTLLADRFQLKAHHETQQGTVFVLSVDKSGHKLKPPKDTDRSIIFYIRNTPLDQPGVSYSQEGHNATLPQLAERLSGILGRPVLDQTGIKGNFDFRVDYATDNAPAETGPSILTAIREQLGLRLEAQKGPVEFLVIDHAEKPSAN